MWVVGDPCPSGDAPPSARRADAVLWFSPFAFAISADSGTVVRCDDPYVGGQGVQPMDRPEGRIATVINEITGERSLFTNECDLAAVPHGITCQQHPGSVVEREEDSDTAGSVPG